MIAKVKQPSRISEFRPISLCNVSVKIVTKVFANRLKHVLADVVDKAHSAFVSRRLIIDNVLVAFEVFHYMRKLDMMKAYDRVEWVFLKSMMLQLGVLHSGFLL